ncbi:MAG: hypothetical protein KME04_16465 [Pleurocapsa minor GSE-CHR-MK-17-07R]|jgi:methionyl-tRNA formyltransferase|nr:hypothetical protein [Pleurocapsa minor GSE-CHR-MK 17-07R]
MNCVVLCATRRGYRFLEKLIALAPEMHLIVFSFREEPHEPPFMDDIRALTVSAGGEFHETRKVSADKWQQFWSSTSVDLMFMVSWRYLVPDTIYSRARLGAFVFHDSLLPAYRGFAPTVWAIVNGEDHTGVSMFHIAGGVDSGDLVHQHRVEIGPDDTITNVIERVTLAYLHTLEHVLPAVLEGKAASLPQDHSLATYTCKRIPDDNRIDWSQSANTIYNLIRGVTRPYTGAFTHFQGQKLTIWTASLLRDFPRYVGIIPGRVIEIRAGEGVVVLAGTGALLLHEVQLADDPPVNASTLLTSLSHTLGRD